MRPNIIIFNPDEMRADTLGHLGNEAAYTPFMDSMVKEDTVSFRNAYCQSPVCVPSRCSFTTGLYPHVRGHRTMAYLLRDGEETLFSELKKNGYHVWMNARNDLIAAQYPHAFEEHASEIYYGGNKKKTGEGPENCFGPGTKNFNAMYQGVVPSGEDEINYTDDDEDLDAAISAIRNKPEDKPLCMFLGLQYPHPPYKVEERFYSKIDKDKLPERVRPEECSGKAEILDAIRKNQQLSDYTDDEWTELRATYYGMAAKVDYQFERLCEALKEAGEYDNSAIFFFSDHGDFTGDYGLAEKAQNSFEDCLTHVPFLIKPPKGMKVDAGISDSLTELVDLYATVMDMAEVEPSHSHFGISLRDAVADRNSHVRDFVTCEGGRNPEEIHCDEFHAGGPQGTTKFSPYYPRHFAQTDAAAHSRGYMVRTEKHKLISRVDGRNELYDLSVDPKEKINEIDNEKYSDVKNDLEKKLLMWLMRTADIVPFDYDRRFSDEMIWAKVKGMVPSQYEEEIKEKIRNGANMFSLIIECRRRFGEKG